MKLRESYENPIIQEIYKSYLGAPLSECARNSCTPASTPGRCPMSNNSVCLPLWAGQPRVHTRGAAFFPSLYRSSQFCGGSATGSFIMKPPPRQVSPS
ncbi:iron hydrogenase small subunit [Atopobium sp. oral taxon 416]|uniref:iron hydrogenase small subunit n=1 Tax=Atopobium sp. oral taxon 416 TaxID=712157 RepID=UPI001BA56318|nr:iron hydrogenase small subunit [Atopobium sp. oral taxon 416]QUC02638.1 iron hydrogenase small subunit [Atopobium sp. oral taxon 416]